MKTEARESKTEIEKEKKEKEKNWQGVSGNRVDGGKQREGKVESKIC